jgi:serine/threonine protein kinase
LTIHVGSKQQSTAKKNATLRVNNGEMSNKTDWEIIGERLGSGGQSDVFLVRTPTRQNEIKNCIQDIIQALGLPLSRASLVTRLPADERAKGLAQAMLTYTRPDLPSELGAMKVFRIRRGGAPAQQRLRTEIAILQQKKPGLPKLLDSNEEEQWMVTEYFPEGTLEKHPLRYKGQPVLAVKAFQSLVATVASALHKDKIVHRDIKPANVFISSDGRLIPGDFGIVYLPDQNPRMTHEDERVGPWDYMPQWADWGTRLDSVEPNFDVYMLGKLLWCMVAGSLRLPREYHKRPEFDLTTKFPNDPRMYMVNKILDKCLVEDSHQCLPSAQDLLPVVNEALAVMERGGQLLSRDVPRPCHFCGKGFYEPEILRQDNSGVLRFWNGSEIMPRTVEVFVCSYCGRVEFFKTAPR